MATCRLPYTLAPFLYPPFHIVNPSRRILCRPPNRSKTSLRHGASLATAQDGSGLNSEPNADPFSPELDYTTTPFIDTCTVNVKAGDGGHGCVSFLRDLFIADGPPNGGDGGSGGNVYIQAVNTQTSLHKIARRHEIQAGRGANGRGKGRGGERGMDVIIEVPVGTVIREIERQDPFEEEQERRVGEQKRALQAKLDDPEAEISTPPPSNKWLLYPGSKPSDLLSTSLPKLPAPRRSHLFAAQLPAPIHIDLSTPTPHPQLLAAGALGGLGNTQFVTAALPKPKLATRGDSGVRLSLTLELKLLADVGLVGLPNAGKSTLLRALSNARARVGHWAFTTLRPNMGTIVFPEEQRARGPGEEGRTHVSVADIPGLVVGAHADKGLGMSFLRHVERARVLCFVVDLADADVAPVDTLKALWRELRLYARAKAETEDGVPVREFVPLHCQPGQTLTPHSDEGEKAGMRVAAGDGILGKPWVVVATKADVEGTQERYLALIEWLERISGGKEMRPQGGEEGWKGQVRAFPVSAIKSEGMPGLVSWIRRLLDAYDGKT